MTSSLRKCWRREILPAGSGWLKSFPKEREPILVLHLGYAAERFGANPEIPRLLSDR